MREPYDERAGPRAGPPGRAGSGCQRVGERRAVGKREVSVELEQRDEHEAPGGDLGVRERQAVRGVLELVEEQDVNVDQARAVARASRPRAQRPLDLLAGVEQLLRTVRGLDHAGRR